jgi:Leucine-rich repeat (LRR) protein
VQVKRLSLAHNRIEKIEDDAFSGIHDTLMSLDLEDNKLTSVPYELARLTNLTLLYLSRNKIDKVDAGVLQNACRHLEVLDLNHNNLTNVPADEMRRCHGLTSLGLSHNRVLFKNSLTN